MSCFEDLFLWPKLSGNILKLIVRLKYVPELMGIFSSIKGVFLYDRFVNRGDVAGNLSGALIVSWFCRPYPSPLKARGNTIAYTTLDLELFKRNNGNLTLVLERSRWFLNHCKLPICVLHNLFSLKYALYFHNSL